ncbi:MAG: hypothetical protein A3C93_06620 [Candidatus Lloydbacteria bacterium RIFCSPHIGHO2_02_FULL_54_17]|uniref:Uncharacterized protein n=1 Tax=Candidatus Lloydbacteria bacterium RIFCSPHIGHO2_02_FULL_54_17 TaxID=1798664 RepID=A0A1G2DCA5_9BACT|nr:MAG: hypothetical protein A2762_05395 [Candidatus Lloydbacteria bacterium RIFCSPHIGHO2_01_FULL_54_11]OGZ11173.1 MAG: hypothetical protein A3C93_06620 [Candidatus Lloydbacteria bacterium RIFCSPHIGHO2_02_FULL_54_17]OGZ14972.1 MAG: hypothetical protein A2948_00800 [Candidatus Lloydbacteria bacterium RIFCSPLOWO2_01_FULL_54_18]
MVECELSEFEQVRARKLGQELTNRLSQFCEREFSDQEIEEIRRLRSDLEQMGFQVQWSAGFDMGTGKGAAEVKLWLPDPTAPETVSEDEKNDEPQT